MERRLTAKGHDRRQQLMDFAAHRFAGGGYHPTSVAEVVQGLGVGKGVFYWYFESKEELFTEILQEAQQDLRTTQLAAILDETDPLRRIELGIRASIAWLDANRHFAVLFRFAATESRFAPLLRENGDMAVSGLVQHVEEGIAQGAIRDVDPVILAESILGVMNQLSRSFLADGHGSADDVADAAVSFCLQGLRPEVAVAPALP